MSLPLMVHIWSRQIEPTRKLLLLKIADNANENFVAWPAVNKVLRLTGVSRAFYYKCLKEWTAAGILVPVGPQDPDWRPVRSPIYRVVVARLNAAYPSIWRPGEDASAGLDGDDGGPVHPVDGGSAGGAGTVHRVDCDPPGSAGSAVHGVDGSVHPVDCTLYTEPSGNLQGNKRARDGGSAGDGATHGGAAGGERRSPDGPAGRGTGRAGEHFRACEEQIRSAVGDGVWRAWFRDPQGAWHVVAEHDDGARLVLSGRNALWAGVVRQHAPALAAATGREIAVVTLRDQDRAAWHAARAKGEPLPPADAVPAGATIEGGQA
ncbi:MAG: hypothetical protein AB7H93_23545 [Vicinamibacterales bacterium]